jgi:predicted ATPase
MIKFHEINITGLFDRSDVSIPINNNRVIIVGNNGIGKSTILNAFYYVISRQWEKLRDIQFKSIEIRAGTKTYTVEKKWLLEMESPSLHMPSERYMYSSGITRMSMRDQRMLSEQRVGTSSLRSIAKRARMPVSEVQRLSAFLRRNEGFTKNMPTELQDIERYFGRNLKNGRILYLPTYRRIEKDLKSIFPDMDLEDIEEALRLHGGRTRDEDDEYRELVNFGMRDVRAMIREKMESLKGFALSEIRSLSTTYLQSVIRNEVDTDNSKRVQDLDQDGIERILSIVEETLFSQPDKKKIYDVVEKMRKGKVTEGNERYVAHYISSLIEIGQKINVREESIREFVRFCDSYLFDKQFNFDNSRYSLQIEYNNKDSVKMDHLSSGEKQIVSMFAHMILDEDKPEKYVIIDEPELSLSVVWQKKFLEDISSLKSCAFVGGVTHSPFVFDNQLEPYAVDMVSCINK